MNIEDKLQIVIPTFNRVNFLKRTLDTFLSENSPVKNCNIVILDNKSTDGTSELCEEYAKNFLNVEHIRNKYNIGANANITRAYEIASKDYIWVCGDDEVFNFDNFSEVEQAIENGEKAICIAKWVFPTDNSKDNDIGYILLQTSLISAGIYSTSILNDNVVYNMYNCVYAWFQHLVPQIDYINEGGKFYVVKNAIVTPGFKVDKGAEQDEDVTFKGFNIKKMPNSAKYKDWCICYSLVLDLIENIKLRNHCLDVALNFNNVGFGIKKISAEKEALLNALTLYATVSPKIRRKYAPLLLFNISFYDLFRTIWHKLFSYSKTKSHRIFSIFGVKIKIKRKHIKLNLGKKENNNGNE